MTQRKHHDPPQVVQDVEVKHFHTRVDGGWIPIPPDMQTLLGWKDSDEVELVAIYGNQLLIRKKGALRDGN